MFGRLYYPGRTLKEVLNELINARPDLSPDAMDAYQRCFNVNKDGKVFQDVYMKCGVFDPSKNNIRNSESMYTLHPNIMYSDSSQFFGGNSKMLKRMFMFFPSLINWKHNNSNVRCLRKHYPAHEFGKFPILIISRQFWSF